MPSLLYLIRGVWQEVGRVGKAGGRPGKKGKDEAIDERSRSMEVQTVASLVD